MPKEVLDILDTAVKIGLGALISGTTTYYLTKLNNRNSLLKEQRDYSSLLQKERREKRAKLAEQCIENLDPFFTAFSNFLASIDGAVKSGNLSQEKINPKSESYKFISQYDKKLTDSRVHYHACISKLNLIGFKESRIALNLIIKHEGRIRETIMFNKIPPTQDDINLYMSKYQKLKDSFYEKLNNEFDDIFINVTDN
ncbi:hypothetical protein PSEHALCIP103_02852 [Pseudoalteromonas haloplanktis]|uniref:Uncharacterized protein n=1 Tax=Pseudoalteromonas haloplanktis TaxID=228 RepID=A0A9W4R297_PSEHA|nr:hypothetical protein [Pseudoalteromonas haloplanktis]CAH9063135.1 hypothetical protein PSEHALCIP103_02852 [Pseudoalteromonas haloplanktis]